MEGDEYRKCAILTSVGENVIHTNGFLPTKILPKKIERLLRPTFPSFVNVGKPVIYHPTTSRAPSKWGHIRDKSSLILEPGANPGFPRGGANLLFSQTFL